MPGEQRVCLPGLGFEVSRLGFGTSALMSRVNRRDSVRLLETAVDHGVTHFDTARSYGFGEAESAVGDVLAGRRDRITVTTKVGIRPPPRSAALSAAKAVARGLLRAVPGIRAPLRRGAGGLVKAGRFDTPAMTKSLHASLRQLRTEYVDFLLLHEPSARVLATGEPFAFLEQVRKEGKVRHLGIAASPEMAAPALMQLPRYSGVLQVANNVFVPAVQGLSPAPDQAMFIHSVFGSMDKLLADLRCERELADCWSRELQVDIARDGTLAKLVLQWGLATLPQGVVLFTSTKQAHIRENAAALGTAASSQQLQRLEQLVRDWVRTAAHRSSHQNRSLH